MKTTPFLDFYKQSMKSGFMPMTSETGGLCYTAPLSNERNNLVELFEPYNTDSKYGFSGYNGEGLYCENWTVHGIPEKQLRYGFSPLRQTIVLFCACINNEL
jgi:hypothetical protein